MEHVFIFEGRGIESLCLRGGFKAVGLKRALTLIGKPLELFSFFTCKEQLDPLTLFHMVVHYPWFSEQGNKGAPSGIWICTSPATGDDGAH